MCEAAGALPAAAACVLPLLVLAPAGVGIDGPTAHMHTPTHTHSHRKHKTDEDGSPRYPASATIPRNSSISHLSQEQAKVKLIRDAIRAEDKRLRGKVRFVGVLDVCGSTIVGVWWN